MAATDPATFKENFWDSELGNFSSYEKLLRKIKENQKITKDYLDFMKTRASAQELYGKSLQKLGKVAGSKNELGVMGRCWQNCLQGTEGVGAAVIHAASAMDTEVVHASELAKKQREQRRREEDDVKQIQNALKAAMNKAQTRKRQYEGKVREKHQAEVVLKQQEGKDTTKALQRVQQATQQCETATANLTQAEQQLEDARAAWERRMEICYEVFEALEEQRLTCVSNLQFAIMESEKERLSAEQTIINQTLESTEEDVSEELVKFVNANKSNDEPPTPIRMTVRDSSDNEDDFDSDTGDGVEYECINVVPSASPATSARGSHGEIDIKRDLSTLQRRLFGLLPKKKEKSMSVASSDVSSEDPPSPAARTTPAKPPRRASQESAVYAAVDKEVGTYSFSTEPDPEEVETTDVGLYKGAGELMRVIYSYEAKHASDISLMADDLVTLTQHIDDEWAEVRGGCGKHGYFPKSYLEPASS